MTKMIIMIMIFECDFRYAHMQIVDMRRLKRSFATFLQRNLSDDRAIVKTFVFRERIKEEHGEIK